MICGALAAPLLEPLGAPNFAIHLPGDSSRGKTSMLKIAASVYGDPGNERWLASWNATGVAAELRAAILTDLPQCYDEVGSGDAQGLERAVYMLVNGLGRSRGRADLSMRETPSWRTVLLSTGERELADESASVGAQVRVIQLPVSRFGALDARGVDELRDACAAESGTFGRAWIEHLLSIDDWAPYVTSWRVATKRLRTLANNPLQARVAGYFATLQTAEMIAEPLGLGLQLGATMERLFLEHDRRAAVQPLADRALDLMRDWFAQEPDAFPPLLLDAGGGDRADRRNTSSRTLHGYRSREGGLLLIPNALRSHLDAHHLSLSTVAREWKLRGWLDHDADRLTKNVRIGGGTQRVYAVRASALEVEQ